MQVTAYQFSIKRVNGVLVRSEIDRISIIDDHYKALLVDEFKTVEGAVFTTNDLNSCKKQAQDVDNFLTKSLTKEHEDEVTESTEEK